MRTFVVFTKIISIVFIVILAIISFCIEVDVILGLALSFSAVFSSLELAWFCSIDNKANLALGNMEDNEKIYELTKALNRTIKNQKDSLKEIENLKIQIAYLSGQQASGKTGKEIENK